MNSKTLHLVVGSVTVLAFLGTGVYMGMHFPDLYASNEVIRYQFRANHVYLLMSGLINLALGLYTKPNYGGWRSVVFVVSSGLLLLAPVLLLTAFFTEPPQATDMRPLTFFGVLMLLVGVVLANSIALSVRQQRGRSGK